MVYDSSAKVSDLTAIDGGAFHEARGRTGNDLIRFRQTLGDFQFRAEIATNHNFADLDCATLTYHTNSGLSRGEEQGSRRNRQVTFVILGTTPVLFAANPQITPPRAVAACATMTIVAFIRPRAQSGIAR